MTVAPRFLLFVGVVLLSLSAQAGTLKSGDYVVRYSAVNSLQVPSQVARDNGFERHGNTAIVTITLQRPTADDPLHAVDARISGYAQTLMGKKTTLHFRRVTTANSTYSLAELPLSEDKQKLTLNLDVEAVGNNTEIPLRFTHTFYKRQ